MPADARSRASTRPIVALVHHPLGLETRPCAERRAALLASEARGARRWPQRVIVTSPPTARLLAGRFRRAAGQHHGRRARHRAGAARAAAPARRSQLLAVGAVSPRKGYDVLVAALAASAGPRLAGRPSPAPSTAIRRTPRRSRDAIAGAGLEDRIALAGAVDDATLERALRRSADLFVSPSLFEGYGMVLAEALARGLPHRRLDRRRGGRDACPTRPRLKVPPGDAAALARSAAPRDRRRGPAAPPCRGAPGPPARRCRAGPTPPRRIAGVARRRSRR